MGATVTTTEEKIWDGGNEPMGASYGKMMMWFFILSDALTFTGFLAAYGFSRFKFADSWPIADEVFNHFPFLHGQDLPMLYVALMTFILIFSSVTMVLAVEAGHRNSKKEVIWWMIATIIGGFTFLGCQALEWSHLHHEGFWWGTVPSAEVIAELGADSISAQQFANLFFTITGFHGFHVFSGVVINIIILIMTMVGTFERRGHYLMVEKVGLYWHFVDLVWVFVFTFFYLV